MSVLLCLLSRMLWLLPDVTYFIRCLCNIVHSMVYCICCLVCRRCLLDELAFACLLFRVSASSCLHCCICCGVCRHRFLDCSVVVAFCLVYPVQHVCLDVQNLPLISLARTYHVVFEHESASPYLSACVHLLYRVSGASCLRWCICSFVCRHRFLG